MATKTTHATAARLKLNLSMAAPKSPSSASKNTLLNKTVMQQPASTATTNILPPVASSSTIQHQRATCNQASQHSPTLPQPTTPTKIPQTQSCPTSALPQTPAGITASPQTQSGSSSLASAPLELPTKIPQSQPCQSIPTSAASQPLPPIASTTGLQTQSCASNSLPARPQLGPGTQSSPPATVSSQRNVVQMVVDKLVAWFTIAIGLAAIIVAVYYGAVMLNYAQWTKHNDFREGCINDRDHNLPLSAECVTELKLPRVSAIKRQIEAMQDAYVDNALRWTVAICIPVLTCVFYLVRMRVFVRDGPTPVVSLARIDLSNCTHGYHGNGHENRHVMMAGNDNDLSGPGHVQDEKVYDHLQQAQANSSPSDAEPDEDYFQAWKDRMKGSDAKSEAGESNTRSTPRSRRGSGSSISAYKLLENGIASDLRANETIPPRVFEVEFQPSGNRVECEHIKLDGPLAKILPTDGPRLNVQLDDAFDGFLVFKCPLERGATHVELLNEYTPFPPSSHKALHKRDIWARRMGLPGHRFLYLVATGYGNTRHRRGAISQ